MAEIPFGSIGLLLLVACLIAMISRKLGMPYIVGLVAAGFAIALLPNAPDLPFNRELVFNVLLPPLVFAGALELDWKQFRAELPLTLTLAFLGVGLAAAVVAGGMHWLVGWSWIGAALFGALIAATDPVSVIAAFREMGAERRLSMVVESESLLNDGIAAVLFAVLTQIASGASPSFVTVVPSFLWTLGGALAIGSAVSAAILLLARRTNDPLVEITLTTIAAYGSFQLAEHFHASGIIAAMVAGLALGTIGRGGSIASAAHDRLDYAWEYFAFLANSFIFMLIGMNAEHQQLTESGVVTAAIALLVVLASRALSIYPLALLFAPSRWRLPLAYQHVLFWGGLRGALALALALAVPVTVPERSAIIITAFVVVSFSIVIQGLTMPQLLGRLGLVGKQPREAATGTGAAG